jgi:ferric-chelate reductase
MSWLSPTLNSRALSPADRLLKAKQQKVAVQELWTFLASVIALLTCLRALYVLQELFFKPPKVANVGQTDKLALEAPGKTAQRGRTSLRRTPAALAAAFRIVAFRLSIPVGPGSLASVSELVFILGYIAAIFTLLLTDSTVSLYSIY